MVKQPEREAATSSDESLHLEIGLVRADGAGSMHTADNHKIEMEGR